jgi:hypothetical protein
MSRAVELMADHVRELRALLDRCEREGDTDEAKLLRLRERLEQAECDLAIVRGK